MNIEIGNEFKQVEELVGYPYNRVGEIWTVHQVSELNIITLRNEHLGLGVSEVELNEYFELYVEEQLQKANTVVIDEVLNEEVRVIRNGIATIVILSDGSKGVSKCLPEDTYDAAKGYDIALTRAKIKRLQKHLKKISK